VLQLKGRRLSGVARARAEGRDTDWVVVDAGNTVVHMFLPPVRRQYDLESLWTGMDLDEWLAAPGPHDDPLLWVRPATGEEEDGEEDEGEVSAGAAPGTASR
jgi:hypothetical protein